MAIYGNKVVTKPYPSRFCYVSTPNDKGKFSLELIVPKDEADELSDALYGDNTRIIEMNKTSKNAKKPKKLYSPVYKYDTENKTYFLDDNDEKIEDEEVVKFSFSSKNRPKIQFKKGLDKTAIVGSGSVIALSCNIYAGSFTDEKNKVTEYTALSMDSLRVHELVSFAGAESAFEEDDDFKDSDDDFEDAEREEEEPKPTTKSKGKRDF